MKDILTAPFVKEMCDTTANMYRLGWDERNGGNISYMLDEEEVAQYREEEEVAQHREEEEVVQYREEEEIAQHREEEENL